MKPRVRTAVAIAFAVSFVGAWVAFWTCSYGVSDRERSPPTVSVLQALGPSPEDDRFSRALLPREFHFPEDHGPHPMFRNEWWYWTGNLDGEDGRQFGYQLTVFRSALAPPSPTEPLSAWSTSQVYLAHFTVTDVNAGEFHAFERISRGALGLAGAQANPFRVWTLDFGAEGPAASSPAPSAPSVSPMHLGAKSEGVAIDLSLEAGKPIVLQGDRGLSQKGPARGNASYYYSMTRMPTRGEVTVAGHVFRVTGDSWMDREWSTSALDRDQVGWDWLALQLSDGSELMVYRLRDRADHTDPYSSGTLVTREGTSRVLSAAMIELESLPRGVWRSPRSGWVYPRGFRVKVVSEGLDLEVVPLVSDQELDVTFRYWEGAVRVTGSAKAGPVTGRGYLELTGYGDALPGQR